MKTASLAWLMLLGGLDLTESDRMAERDGSTEMRRVDLQRVVEPGLSAQQHKVVETAPNCTTGYYCTSGVLYESCSSPYVCLPCGSNPDGTDNGLRCESCALDFESEAPVCLSGLGCQSGRAAILWDGIGDAKADYKRRLFCRPSSIQAGQIPGLCAGNEQGGLMVASAGEIWRIRNGDNWIETLARFQPYVVTKNVVQEAYVATFPETDSRVQESSYKWAGSMMRAEHAVSFKLHANDKLARSGVEACDDCIWHIRDAHDSDEFGIEVELEFRRKLMHPITLENVDEPPTFRLSAPAVKALGACLDLLEHDRVPDGDVSLQAGLVLQRARQIISERRAEHEAESAMVGQWKAPETTFMEFIDKLSTRSFDNHFADRIAGLARKRLACPVMSLLMSSGGTHQGWSITKCVPFADVQEGARMLYSALTGFFMPTGPWQASKLSTNGYLFLEEFSIGGDSMIRKSYTTMLTSWRRPMPADKIDDALQYVRQFYAASQEVRVYLEEFAQDIMHFVEKLNNAVHVASEDTAFARYCGFYPRGFLGTAQTRAQCESDTEKMYAVYLQTDNNRRARAATGDSVCRSGQRLHHPEGKSCLPAHENQPTCATGETSWCLHKDLARERCCCAETATEITRKILAYKVRKATVGCIAYRFAMPAT